MDIKRTDAVTNNYFLQHAQIRPEKEESGDITVLDAVKLGGSKEADQGVGDNWKKEWTFLHYTAADNDLKKFLLTDVNEMEKVGSTTQMNLVIQLDTGENCKRYYIERDEDPKNIRSKVVENMGPQNMSDPKTLAEFIKFGIEKYPAKHYALIISDHGGGWKGAVQDDSHNGWMTTPDIRKGLDEAQKETGVKLDVLGFDACLMANSEVAKELKDTATYLVGSEQVEGGNGWEYTPLLNPEKLQMVDEALQKRAELTPELMAKGIVETAKNDQQSLPTLSAIDLGKAEDITKASDELAKALIKTDTSGALLQQIAKKTENFYGFKDQYHYAENLVKNPLVKDPELKEAAKNLMSTIKGSLIAEQHDPEQHPNAHGITAEIPSYGPVGRGYDKLKFAKETLWDEAMGKINAHAKLEGYTAQKEELPFIKEFFKEGLNYLGQHPALAKLTSLAGDEKFLDRVTNKMGEADSFESYANEPDFAESKGLGAAGLLAIAGMKKMINLNASREVFQTQATEFLEKLMDDGQLGGISGSMFAMVAQSIMPQEEEVSTMSAQPQVLGAPQEEESPAAQMDAALVSLGLLPKETKA